MTEQAKLQLEKLRRYCASQDRCHQQIHQKLDDNAYLTQDEKDEILISLIQDDFLNELRFARSFVRGKFKIKKWGRFKIVNHLMQFDIPNQIIDQALSEIDEEDYYEVFQEWLNKKMSEGHDKRKIYSFLISKGFENYYILQNWGLN